MEMDPTAWSLKNNCNDVSKAKIAVPTIFFCPISFEKLKEQVGILVGNNLPAKVVVKVAMMQADPMIACLLLIGDADLVMSVILILPCMQDDALYALRNTATIIVRDP